MADHAELVKDMQDVEKLPTVERMKQARKRRQQQLKKYAEYEKKQDKVEKNNKKNAKKVASAGIQRTPKRQRDQVRFTEEIIFLEATARNDVEEVTALLNQGISPNIANEDGLTALHQSCIDDCEGMVLLLLEYGANVNARDRELWTPLHAAATCGHSRICQHLIQKNADLLALNSEGNMPYDICEDEPTLELIETSMANLGITQDLIDHTRLCLENDMLIDIHKIADAGGNLEVKDRQGAVPLHAAAANGYATVAAYLLEKGVDANTQDMDGWTPAHAAACWGHMNVLILLASHGANLDAKTKYEESLLDLCEDETLRIQIEDIKQKAQIYREQHKSIPWHQHSSSHSLHGSSVRRHSMREKRRLSLVEAKAEAKMFGVEKYDVPVTNIDDVELLATSTGDESRADWAVGEGSMWSIEGRGSLRTVSSPAPVLRSSGSAARIFGGSAADDGGRERAAEFGSAAVSGSSSKLGGGEDDKVPSKHKYERRLSLTHAPHDSVHILRALSLDYAFAVNEVQTMVGPAGDTPPPSPPKQFGSVVEPATATAAAAVAVSATAVDVAPEALSAVRPDEPRGLSSPSATEESSSGTDAAAAACAVAPVVAAHLQNGISSSFDVHTSVAHSNNNTISSSGDLSAPLHAAAQAEHVSLEEPLKKFTSHEHEIVGGHEHRRCCVIV